MSETDKLMADVFRKIEREKALIHAASQMIQSTNNTNVQARADSQIRDGRKNIAYLEEKMRELQLRRSGSPPGPDGRPYPPSHRDGGQRMGGGPTPPPKGQTGSGYFPNGRADYGDAGPGGYSQGNSSMMPPRAPFGDPRPYSSVPKARPNFSKLGMFSSLPLIDTTLMFFSKTSSSMTPRI